MTMAGDPLVGRVLDGRYRIDDQLGEGGMGTVYRATHVLMEKPIAIKILRSVYAADDRAVKRFQREAKSASRLDHEHCVRVTDFGIDQSGKDKLLYLAMELLDARLLSDELCA